MILDRLLVRQRLNLLVAVPLAAVALLTVPLLTGRVDQASAAGATSRTAGLAREVGGLVEEVQRARLLSVAYLDARLVPATQLDVQLAAVSDARAQLLRHLDPATEPELVGAVTCAEVVAAGGPPILSGQASDQEVLGIDDSVVDALIRALRLDRQPTAGSAQAWTLAGLGSLLLADEAASQSGALLLAAASNPVVRAQAQADAAVADGVEQQQVSAFTRLAAASEVALFQRAVSGQGAQNLADAAAEVGLAGASTPQSDVARHVFAAVDSQTTLRQLVEATIAQDVSAAALSASNSALRGAAGISAAALLLLIGVLALSVLVGRSVSLPLRRLTEAAGSVADVAAEQLADVADDDAGPAAVRRLPQLPVTSDDELGELAVAFNRVRATTAQLLERQSTGRRNVAAMFAGIGRRTSNLVGRQLALIDLLEGAEEDQQTLHTLYRLDQVSTRLRRNASSLVVLSGDRDTGTDGADRGPVRLPDAVRAALGSVEDFQRVALSMLPDVHLVPGATGDVVLILAELIENAVLFSPPHTQVEVAAWVTQESGYALTVVDHGIGMPPGRLAEENARLRQRERLDLAPTDVLGLFVVGRVSRRHGIDVTLQETPGGGVTARILLPGNLFVANAWAGSAEALGRSVRSVRPLAPEPLAPQLMTEDQLSTEAVSHERVAHERVAHERVAPESAPRGVVVAQLAPAPGPGDPDLRPPDSAGLRRRVPGTHWEGPPSSPREPVARGSARQEAGWTGELPLVPVDRVSASQVAAILDGAPRDLPPPGLDPEATRRLVQEVEDALALAPREVTGPADPMAGNGSGPPRVRPNGFGGGNGPHGADVPPLARRVPGATLAALGAGLPEAARPPGAPPVTIDPDETLQAILDVDEAVRRAREQQATGEGYRSSEGAAGRWGGRADGGGT